MYILRTKIEWLCGKFPLKISTSMGHPCTGCIPSTTKQSKFLLSLSSQAECKGCPNACSGLQLEEIHIPTDMCSPSAAFMIIMIT